MVAAFMQYVLVRTVPESLTRFPRYPATPNKPSGIDLEQHERGIHVVRSAAAG
jgi:hypothetical protein